MTWRMAPAVLAAATVALAAHADTQLRANRLSANGLELAQLECSLEKTNPFSLMMVVTALGGQKQALDKCAPQGAAFEVRWTAKGGRLTAVKVLRSSAKGKAPGCVKAALSKVASPLEGKCTGVLLVGDAKRAQAAAVALLPTPKP